MTGTNNVAADDDFVGRPWLRTKLGLATAMNFLEYTLMIMRMMIHVVSQPMVQMKAMPTADLDVVSSIKASSSTCSQEVAVIFVGSVSCSSCFRNDVWQRVRL